MMSLIRKMPPMVMNLNKVKNLGCVMFSSSSDPHRPPYIDPPSNEPPIPIYARLANENLALEDIEVKKSRLLYQSRKRGIKENCLLLATFAGEHLSSMSESELADYDQLINGESNDWEIFYWIVGQKEVPARYQTSVMDKLKLHCKNKNRESRLMQPDLY